MRGLWFALGFLTRLPVSSAVFDDPAARAASPAWYPVVGLIVGVVLALSAWLLQYTSPLLSAALLVLIWVGLTGALHLDGLADTADAWIGGMGSRERTLAIMKDPRCGPAGVVALVLVLTIKLAALADLALSQRVGVLLIAPVLGRAALTALMSTTPYARSEGMAQGLEKSRAGSVVACLLAVGAGLVWGVPGVAATLVAITVFTVWRRAQLRRLGGFTGDTAGATAEMVELAVLVGWSLVPA